MTVSFAGDAANVPATTSVPVVLYQPQSFVIWGGNTIPPHIGDHINFWGSQWDRQVTAGDYSNNASFKGWATPVASALVPCGLTGHANGTCWTSKPGNSSPPAAIERYISVIVSTSILKNGGSIDGNIAAVVVVRVDASPVYGNDPGKPGYGTIVAVITDGARLFGTSTPAPSYAGYFFRHLATPRTQIASLTHSDLASLFSLTTPSARVTSVLRPTPLTIAAGTKRYSFYTPEMHLLAETALTSSGAPTTAYEYIWFNGHPVAQIDAGAATHWTFTDHLGTPILLTNTDASTYWRAEHEPFGAVYALRSADVHQPLRLPGQEAEQLNLGANGVTEREYNIFRWYRAGWGRYTQADPLGLNAGINVFAYTFDNPLIRTDRLGLRARVCCKIIPATVDAAAAVYAVTGIMPNPKRHCFFEFDDGYYSTAGLHFAGEESGSGTARAAVCAATASVEFDHGFDLDRTNQSTCGPWSKCGANCAREFAETFPRNTRYCLFGPNSNTFVSSGARKCNLTPPAGETANAPGW